MTTYAQKLRDPRWQKKRLEIFERDHWQCQICGDKSTALHLHHHWYRRDTDPWAYVDAAFITVCERCHGRIHAAQKDGALAEMGREPGKFTAEQQEMWRKGFCPTCGSRELRDKGSFDKCMECGERISALDIDHTVQDELMDDRPRYLPTEDSACTAL